MNVGAVNRTVCFGTLTDFTPAACGLGRGIPWIVRPVTPTVLRCSGTISCRRVTPTRCTGRITTPDHRPSFAMSSVTMDNPLAGIGSRPHRPSDQNVDGKRQNGRKWYCLLLSGPAQARSPLKSKASVLDQSTPGFSAQLPRSHLPSYRAQRSTGPRRSKSRISLVLEALPLSLNATSRP